MEITVKMGHELPQLALGKIVQVAIKSNTYRDSTTAK
jgi:hypothetical protein